ncbi:hypothetical protein R2R35_09295 [Anaerocolumna sp. AGMB13020]|uniref:YczE/YyaS/YitT family protein n=1 Tax=Anaerocolumna sp. AGMB13020 TaxID=3081750 RepID=UPI0029536B2E|nr:hypothetical protein [Anaerocolumna sp. AGMB13020]WOO38684.1 hypothetical protein R2R35_09295 [Anaerocolumna sp. AGMB13020]
MKTQMKFDLKDKKRILAVLAAVIIMGFSLSFLIRLNFGTDPCSSMNLGISNKLSLSFGSWQVIFNSLLFIIVILYDRTQIGWGTLANMLLVGYCADFFTWLFNQILPAGAFQSLLIRIAVLLPALILFILSAAVYMAVDLGSAPYDATVFILASRFRRIPFRVIRMAWDLTACIIGFLMGTTIGFITVAIAFLLGPVIAWVKTRLDKVFFQTAQAS